MTNSHCAGTTKMWYIKKSRERVAEKTSLQATSEYSQRRCRRDMMWKTCSKHELRRLETTDCGQSTGVYVGQSVMEARPSVDVSGPQDRSHGGVHGRGMMVLFPADNCTREQPA